jgi:hypothetical protein
MRMHDEKRGQEWFDIDTAFEHLRLDVVEQTVDEMVYKQDVIALDYLLFHHLQHRQHLPNYYHQSTILLRPKNGPYRHQEVQGSRR